MWSGIKPKQRDYTVAFKLSVILFWLAKGIQGTEPTRALNPERHYLKLDKY